MTRTSRRTFLRRAVAASAAATLMKGLPGGWTGSVYADDSPETRFQLAATYSWPPTV